jgi:hypothetical protein
MGHRMSIPLRISHRGRMLSIDVDDAIAVVDVFGTMMSTFSCWTIMMSSALINILVGPCGSQRYAGESASSILLYCSAPNLVSDTSSPGNTPPAQAVKPRRH